MVDLFGKKKLEDRILELQAALAKQEGEKEQLLRTLEKREEKMRKLSSANQEANLALKAAEQKAAALTLSPAPVQAADDAYDGQKPKAKKPTASTKNSYFIRFNIRARSNAGFFYLLDKNVFPGD